MDYINTIVSSWIDRLWLTFVGPALPQMRLGPENAPNPVMIQFFTWDARHPDMSWWKHFQSELLHLADFGFTLAWLPPPNKAMAGKRGQGYDAYDLWDLGEFNQRGSVATRWGTREDLLEACSAARQSNIGVIIDAVLNHKLGADKPETFLATPMDPKNRLRALGREREIKGWTTFDFPGRQGKYSDMTWTHEHFSGLDWDDLTQTNGVYRIENESYRGWSNQVDTELGNYDYLLGIDINHRHPAVRDDLFAWGSWVLDVTNGGGFRLDAIKHIHRSFLLEFIQRVRNVPTRDKLFVVAECWTDDVCKILPYIRAFQGQAAFFDVPLHDNFHQASKLGSSYDLRRILHHSIVEIRPNDAVTFVDNHDTQIGQTLESWVGTNFKVHAYALILLRSYGFPCVFYGDLYPNHECFDQATSKNIRGLLLARQTFAHGPTRDYFHYRNCIGFVRLGDAAHPGCVVVMSNNAPDPETPSRRIRMNVGPNGRNAVFRGLFDPSRYVIVDSNGWGEFYCSRGEVEVWMREAPS